MQRKMTAIPRTDIAFTHNVTSRSVFADGAIKAAKFLVNKEEGFYNMNNLFI